MADMYIVTTEHVDDGMWFDDPSGFDTEGEARKFAALRQPPDGHCFGIYECRLVTTVRDLVSSPQESTNADG